ncbi:Aste57867_2952 [Aphanomyces stellatus]|uniref:Microsomal glutathione S-transferase 1 n=1 Tax=Aphanomyces stellatus TaxID=120398 RepID=A0A485KDX2_9STRA|nr:hypothetical protein As57867_002943 [Aphanomyces stellatus]VFT80135.1 Aste57867_2952 [Aphanomyces stellatus]
MIAPDFGYKSAIVCTLLLYIKYVVTTLVGGYKNQLAGLRAPEDTPDQKQHFGLVVDDVEADQSHQARVEAARWSRIVANDLENLPFGLVLVWASISVGGDSGVIGVSVIIFTIARLLHTLFYALAQSHARTASYLTGVVCLIIIISSGVHGAFKDLSATIAAALFP